MKLLLSIVLVLMLFAQTRVEAFDNHTYEELGQAISSADEYRRIKYGDYNFRNGLDDVNYLNKFATISNLINNFWAKDEIDKVQFSQYLMGIWDGILLENYKVIQHPLVKLPIAQKLGEASKDCIIDSDLKNYYDYVYSYIDHENEFILIDAIKAMGSVGSDRDIEVLSNIVKRELPGISEQAVVSLELLQSREAIRELESLKMVVHTPRLSEFIRLRLEQNDEGYHYPNERCK